MNLGPLSGLKREVLVDQELVNDKFFLLKEKNSTLQYFPNTIIWYGIKASILNTCRFPALILPYLVLLWIVLPYYLCPKSQIFSILPHMYCLIFTFDINPKIFSYLLSLHVPFIVYWLLALPLCFDFSLRVTCCHVAWFSNGYQFELHFASY